MLSDFTESSLSAPEFVLRARAAYRGLSRDQLLLRKGEAKQLVDEVLPLSVLLCHFQERGRKPLCLFVHGNQNYDAKLCMQRCGEESDGWEGFVEIVVVDDRVDQLKREALARGEPVWGGDQIRKLGKGMDPIVSEPTAETESVLWRQYAARVRDRISGKAEKGYPSETILLVSFNPTDVLVDPDSWSRFVRMCREPLVAPPFVEVYLVDWGKGLADRLYSRGVAL